ncbi:hypothetical protein MKX01_037119 [Papaver californicum]|nr:hypothetical protein MKX01_037119 [Papaver californicum]
MPLEEELFPSTPGKVKNQTMNRQLHRCFSSTSTLFLWALYLSFQSFVDTGSKYFTASWGGIQWEKQVRNSAQIQSSSSSGMSVLVTGAAGFVGSHVSLALKKRGDGVKSLLNDHGIFIVEGDINDAKLLAKLFDVVAFTHVMHYNIAGLVNLLEMCKCANPQPSIVWASSSSVYGLNEKVPFSESDRTDQPASLYAATKKAGEEITHTYNHIYGLSTTGLRLLRFMKYLTRKTHNGKNRVNLARDFTYIDDIVKGCIGSLDTSGKSTGTGGKKRGPAPYRIFNLGNTSPVTVPTLVSILERHLKVKVKKNVIDMPGNGDVPFTHANISYASNEFGYKPTTD